MSVRSVLRLEGLALLFTALAWHAQLGASWGTFFALFLLPDLALLGYLAGPRPGALAYNLAHSEIGPLGLAFLGLTVQPSWLPLAAIWLAHIGLDRALGFGLKQVDGFRFTHLGVVGTRGRLERAA